MAASFIVLTVFDNQLTVEFWLIEAILDKDTVSESLIVDVDRRSCRINSWFSHKASVNANFFSANSISTRCKRSTIADGLIEGKSSSL